MRCPSVPFRAAPLTFAPAAALGLAAPGAAQGRSGEETRAIESYRLTMPMLRKLLPAMYAPGARRCKHRTQRYPMTLSLAEMTLTLEACSPVATSLRYGKASALPGAVRDNALLLEQNDREIRKLTEAGGQS